MWFNNLLTPQPPQPNPTLFANRFSQQDLPAIEIHLGLVICKIKAISLPIGRIKSSSTHENCVTVTLWHPNTLCFLPVDRVLGKNVSGVAESQLAKSKKAEEDKCPLMPFDVAVVSFLCLSSSIKNWSYLEVPKPVTGSSKIIMESSVKTQITRVHPHSST